MAVGSTIPAIVAAHVAAHGSETILRKKDRGIWKAVTWAELGSHVQAITVGLVATGFGPGHVGAVLSQTRPEAAYASLAILTVGGTCVAVHPDDEAERVEEILRAAQCRLLFVENEEQLDKALTVRAACPSLQRIVIFDLKGLREFSDPGCVGLAAFRGSGAPALGITADMPAIMVFPAAGKFRLLTHGDVMHLLATAGGMLDVRAGDERLAVLPMSTLMEHVLGLHLALMTRCISNYLESPETAVENLQEVQPTVFGADAEAWSRLHERIARAGQAATRVQGALYRWAIGGQGGTLARLLVLKAVRRELGLHRLRIAYVCGAPVPPDILTWASALGITIQRIDGPTKRGVTVDARSRALMEEAYSAP